MTLTRHSKCLSCSLPQYSSDVFLVIILYSPGIYLGLRVDMVEGEAGSAVWLVLNLSKPLVHLGDSGILEGYGSCIPKRTCFAQISRILYLIWHFDHKVFLTLLKPKKQNLSKKQEGSLDWASSCVIKRLPSSIRDKEASSLSEINRQRAARNTLQLNLTLVLLPGLNSIGKSIATSSVQAFIDITHIRGECGAYSLSRMLMACCRWILDTSGCNGIFRIR
eukprot:284819688_4